MKQGSDQIHQSFPSSCKNCFSVCKNTDKGGCCQKRLLGLPGDSKVSLRKESCQTTDSWHSQKESSQERKLIQLKKGLCCFCAKRTGMMSYSCRCGFVFCKKHRLPEKHNCDYDYISVGRSRLKKQNPKLPHHKIEMI